MRLSVIFVISIFALIVLFGVGMNMNDAMGDMPNCPLMGGIASVCQMNIVEHLAGWQRLFTVALSIMVGLGLLLWRSLARLEDYYLLIKRFSLKKNYIYKIFNYLMRVFSSGILHPKIY